jgi:hypothetical protein
MRLHDTTAEIAYPMLVFSTLLRQHLRLKGISFFCIPTIFFLFG